jgi:hypothetical protein
MAAKQHFVGVHVAGPRLVDEPPVGIVIKRRSASLLGASTGADLIGVVTMHR